MGSRAFTIRFGLSLTFICAIGGFTPVTVTAAARSDGDAVRFSLRSIDKTSGIMSATFTDGRTYTGKFFYITGDTELGKLHSLWDGWGARWYPLWRRLWREDEWKDWEPTPEFIAHFKGRVVANLATPNGKHMRCKFQLAYPPKGLVGGGRGRCQTDHKTLDATFPAGFPPLSMQRPEGSGR